MFCQTCRYWKQKDQKVKSIGLVHIKSNIGICQNAAAMDLVVLIPERSAINVIPHSTIETDETFGCIYYESDDFNRSFSKS